MAYGRSTAPSKSSIQKSEQIRQGIERLERRLEDVRRFNPATVSERDNIQHVESLASLIEDALVRTFGSGTPDLARYALAAKFDVGPLNTAYRVPMAEVHRLLRRSKERSIALLQQAISSLEEQLHETANRDSTTGPASSTATHSKVFVVHGRDDGAREAVARFIEALGLSPIVLHEQPNRGRTIIEKVEEHSDVAFAVVLLTPDDEGKAKSEQALKPRARQNVVLELGYFIGLLGRSNVCALLRNSVEIPSDFAGVIYERFDSAGAWRQTLARELKAAGYSFDWHVVTR
jgi:predicted nucleotide-binding protein